MKQIILSCSHTFTSWPAFCPSSLTWSTRAFSASACFNARVVSRYLFPKYACHSCCLNLARLKFTRCTSTRAECHTFRPQACNVFTSTVEPSYYNDIVNFWLYSELITNFGWSHFISVALILFTTKPKPRAISAAKSIWLHNSHSGGKLKFDAQFPVICSIGSNGVAKWELRPFHTQELPRWIYGTDVDNRNANEHENMNQNTQIA